MNGPERQQAIYLNGVSGARPRVPTAAVELEQCARTAMSEQAFAYVVGGAGTGRTVAANREGFDDWRIVPRMLRNVAERDRNVELFGARLASPFVLSPIGVLEMAHDEADVAVARRLR